MEPRIIGIVTAGNLRDPGAIAALSDCRLAELRADGMDPARIPDILRDFRGRLVRAHGPDPEIIFTLRLVRDGGAWDDAQSARREDVWLSILEGEDPFRGWVDVEADEFPRLSPRMQDAFRKGVCKVLLSHHDFSGCPPAADLRRRLAAARGEGLAGFKLAVTVKSRRELLGLLEFAREAAQAVSGASVFSMGDMGRCSRVLAPLLGCPLTYGYLTGDAVAPGQLSVAAMRDFFRGLPARDWAAASIDESLVAWAESRLTGGDIEN